MEKLTKIPYLIGLIFYSIAILFIFTNGFDVTSVTYLALGTIFISVGEKQKHQK